MTKPRGLRESQKQEKRLAERYGGSTNSGSGNGWIRKGDVRTPEVLIEAKYTDAKQFTLKHVDLQLAERQALVDGRDAVFIISFGGTEWAVIREEEYADYRRLLQEHAALKEAFHQHLEHNVSPIQINIADGSPAHGNLMAMVERDSKANGGSLPW